MMQIQKSIESDPIDFSVGKVGPTHLAVEYSDGNSIEWISAGPENGNLSDGIGSTGNNIRSTDAPSKNSYYGRVSPPAGQTVDQYWATLKQASSTYPGNVDYDTFPALSNSYNSNSFVAGIVSATGGNTTLNFSNFVGGSKPLPPANFGY